jgi:SAM-dependent methyltransferase
MKKEVWTMASAWGATGAAYERYSEHFGDALYHCVQRLAPRPGESILDVATGTGWTARLLASREARVTGVDYSEELIAAARKIAAQRGLRITFDVGDAQQLPYTDQSFDAVCSTFGVIFASGPELAARELARVCRPGGRLALAVWATDCTLGILAREVFARFAPPPPDPRPPSPYAWGEEERMRELLEPEFELEFEHGCTVLREPDGDSVWRLWKETHGLTVARLSALDDESKNAFREAFIEFHERYRTPVGIAMPRDYVVATGFRR